MRSVLASGLLKCFTGILAESLKTAKGMRMCCEPTCMLHPKLQGGLQGLRSVNPG